MNINEIRQLNGKTLEELLQLGYTVESQCGGEVAWIVKNQDVSFIMILNDGVFSLDEDSDICGKVDMFDIEIMQHAEDLILTGASFQVVNSVLFREGYELLEDYSEVAERCPLDEETFELSNGWVVVGLM